MWELHNVEESCAEQQWRNRLKSIKSVRLRAAKNRTSTSNPSGLGVVQSLSVRSFIYECGCD